MVGRAVAGQELDVFDGQEQPVVAVIEDAQAIVRRVIDFQGDKAVVAADAVVDVHNQVAIRQRRRVDQKFLGRLPPAALRPARARAEDILFGDHGEPRRDESPLQRQHRGCCDGRRQCRGRPPVGHRLDPVHAVLAQQTDHAVPAAGATARDQDPQAALLQPVDVIAHVLEQRPARCVRSATKSRPSRAPASAPSSVSTKGEQCTTGRSASSRAHSSASRKSAAGATG